MYPEIIGIMQVIEGNLLYINQQRKIKNYSQNNKFFGVNSVFQAKKYHIQNIRVNPLLHKDETASPYLAAAAVAD